MSNSTTEAIQENGISDQEAAIDRSALARSIGLKPVRAWVLDVTNKAPKSGAERTKRSRGKAEQAGLKQVSVTLPVELHPLVKELATRTRAGEHVELVLSELISNLQPKSCSTTEPLAIKISERIADLPWWRRWLLRWLLRWLIAT